MELAANRVRQCDRVRQCENLAELAALALRSSEVDELQQAACRLVADGLGARVSAVLEHLAAERQFVVRAGIGWHEGVVGNVRLVADPGSPAGYALSTGRPLVANRLADETRFRMQPIHAEHGIAGVIDVPIPSEAGMFGVLEAGSGHAGCFGPDAIAFAQAAANLLGVAIERARSQAELRRTLEGRDLLLREIDHRVKNSLQLVASLLGIQRARLSDSEASTALDEAVTRVRAVAETHRALYQSADLRSVAFGRILRDLCQQVGGLNAHVAIHPEIAESLTLDAERALPFGLIVSELLTNAVRHAYPEGQDGDVRVQAGERDGTIEIVIADAGIGLPPETEGKRQGLGTTIIRALSRQIGAEIDAESEAQLGTSVTVRVSRSTGGENG
jgi:two-component system, sensor histidine kinase PdtaS